jgi:hypothetical protein
MPILNVQMTPSIVHCFTVIALVVPLGWARANETGSSTSQLSSGSIEKATDVELQLGFWAGCLTQNSQDVDQLSVTFCEPLGLGADAHDLVGRDLSRHDSVKLCAIDTAVVRSLEQCPSLRQHEEVAITASVLLGVADAWRQRGVYERAGQLYRHANLLVERAGGGLLKRMKMVGALTMFELEYGQLVHAKQLADQYVELAREWQRTASSQNKLIKGLELQATVLRRLGRETEAQAAQDEAKRLAAVPRNCGDRLCVSEPPFRVVCKGNAAGELVCVREQ